LDLLLLEHFGYMANPDVDQTREEAWEQGAGGKGDSSDGELKSMFQFSPLPEEEVISPCSLPPSPYLFLERLYSSPPPMGLIYKIFIAGALGTFVAVLTVRQTYPDKVPHFVWGKEGNTNCTRNYVSPKKFNSHTRSSQPRD
jgi:hypothetical protein